MTEHSYRTRSGYWYRRVQPERVHDRLSLRDIVEMAGLTIFVIVFLLGPAYALVVAAATHGPVR